MTKVNKFYRQIRLADTAKYYLLALDFTSDTQCTIYRWTQGSIKSPPLIWALQKCILHHLPCVTTTGNSSKQIWIGFTTTKSPFKGYFLLISIMCNSNVCIFSLKVQQSMVISKFIDFLLRHGHISQFGYHIGNLQVIYLFIYLTLGKAEVNYLSHPPNTYLRYPS